MAATSISTSNAIAQKIYRPGLIHEAERSWVNKHLFGTSDQAAIQIQDEPSRLRGDTCQIRFAPTEEQAGFGEDDTIEGNEAAITFDNDELKVNWWALAFSQRNQMSQQRVNIDIKKAALAKLSVLWKRRWERALMGQLGGATYLNTAAGLAAAVLLDTELTGLTHLSNNLTGMNAATAVDSNHIVRAKQATDVLVGGDATAVMELDLVNELVLRAQSRSYLRFPIEPCEGGYWILIMHPDQARQLRDGTSAGDWQDLQRALLEGGMDYKKNALYRGFFGLYNNTILAVSDFVPRGWDVADTPVDNTRRALFLGAKAGVAAYGQGYTGGAHLDWVEQVRDYKVWGVEADSVYGFKTLLLNNPDTGSDEYYGCMNLTTYVPT